MWLDVKYIGFLSGQLELFKQLRTDLWNCRCPLCGDSEKDRTKARGYIYIKDGEYRYKCHNCGESMKFSYFLHTVDHQLYKEYRMEAFKEGRSSGKTRRREAPKKNIKYKRKTRVKKEVEPIVEYDFKELDGLQTVSQLPECHFMRKYVKGRMIPETHWNRLYWAKNMGVIAERLNGYGDTYFDSFPRLLLPFVNDNGELTHIQGRAVGDDVPKRSRYYTLEVEANTPKVYGMDIIDPSQPIRVVEGPIDSLFVKNCVGMGGSDIPWHLFDPSNTIFVWDNEPRSKVIIDKMTQAIKRGFAVTFWTKNIRQNDINDMILNGKSLEWVDDFINRNSERGLKAKMRLSRFKVK